MCIEHLYRAEFTPKFSDSPRVVYFTCEDEAQVTTFARLALDKRLESFRDSVRYHQEIDDPTEYRLHLVESVGPVFRP